MISRVAEHCVWMKRYLVRLEALARFMEVNQGFVLEGSLPPLSRWRPLVVVVGEQRSFTRLHGARALANGERVQEFLTWEQANPASLHSSLFWARENARTVRDTISLEMWLVVNELWLWFNSRAARKLYQQDRPDFFREVCDRCLLYEGTARATMLHEEALDFMSLGTALEWVGQVARMLDVKYHSLGPERTGVERPIETAQWLAILRSCLGVEPFFKRGGDTLSGPAVTAFLLLDRACPHAVLHNLERARGALARIWRHVPGGRGTESAELLDELHSHIGSLNETSLMERGIHKTLTAVVQGTDAICQALYADFFSPGPGQLKADSRSHSA